MILVSSKQSPLISSGGFLAPSYLAGLHSPTFTVTYRVRPWWRRWWHRRHGWSTEWTVEYDREEGLVRNTIPRFTAARGELV